MSNVKINSISVIELSAQLAADGALELLDVRTSPEYASAHVPGARLVPLNKLSADALQGWHRPGTPIFVLCQSGGRAMKAIEALECEGCDDCILVEGGTQAWMDAGLPVHRGASTVLPLMRQVQIVIGALALTGSLLALAVNKWFAVLPLILGCGLLFAGISGICGLALLMARMPWNRGNAGETACSCGSEL